MLVPTACGRTCLQAGEAQPAGNGFSPHPTAPLPCPGRDKQNSGANGFPGLCLILLPI